MNKLKTLKDTHKKFKKDRTEVYKRGNIKKKIEYNCATLKEVFKDYSDYKKTHGQGDHDRDVFCTYLKEEAIKHIKHINEDNQDTCDDAQIDWIKYFFNITEEDLK